MNPQHVDFADWDAAYVLGALSPSDRRAFESHMETCEKCRQAVAEVAPTIGLLARVDRERAESLAGDPAEPVEVGPRDGLRDEVVARMRGDSRRRRSWWVGGLAAAAAIVVAAVLAVTIAIAPGLRGIRVVELESLSDAPLWASVELADADWGTRIGLVCRYDDVEGASADDSWTYGLYVVGDDGSAEQVSTWRALAGSTARLEAGSDLDSADIAAIEIRSLTTAAVLMRVDLDSADG